MNLKDYEIADIYSTLQQTYRQSKMISFILLVISLSLMFMGFAINEKSQLIVIIMILMCIIVFIMSIIMIRIRKKLFRIVKQIQIKYNSTV